MSRDTYKLKCGDQVSYTANKHADPILLTFVEPLRNGINRFFSSEFPTQEYHLANDSDRIQPFEEKYQSQIQEKYHAFKGGDDKKRQAYEILSAGR